MKLSLKTITCSVLVASMGMICSAQAPAELHPGQTATISIVFDGVDASKLTNVIAYFNNSNIPTDQVGFTSELDFGDAKPDGPGAFKLSLKIPDSAASGTYKLIQIRAIGEKGAIPITIIYAEGLPSLALTIRNDGRFVKPTIKSVKEL